MKLVINRRFGGFSISEKAQRLLGAVDAYEYEDNRTDGKLVEVVENLGDEANGLYADLEVVEVPDDATDYLINDYDGLETVYYVLNGKIHTA